MQAAIGYYLVEGLLLATFLGLPLKEAGEALVAKVTTCHPLSPTHSLILSLARFLGLPLKEAGEALVAKVREQERGREIHTVGGRERGSERGSEGGRVSARTWIE